MASIQEIKKRITSIESTKQITGSMRLVSSAKVQKAQNHLEAVVAYRRDAEEFLKGLFSVNHSIDNIYFRENSEAKDCVLVLSCDRGLCGAYNMNVARTAIRTCRAKKKPYTIVVGNRVGDMLIREGIEVTESYIGLSETPHYHEAKMLIDQITNKYLKGEIGRVFLVHTHFVSMLSQETIAKQLLPLSAGESDGKKEEFVFEPGFDQLMNNFIPAYITSVLLETMCDAAVCEQSARINSMDTAAKNSDELITTLTLSYNKLRQEAITNEINEIVGGASGVE